MRPAWESLGSERGLWKALNAAAALCVIDRDYKVLHATDAFCAHLGLQGEQVVGRTCHGLWRSTVCNTGQCAVQQALRGIERSEEEIEVPRLDGKTLSCVLTSVPYRGSNGNLIGIVGVLPTSPSTSGVSGNCRDAQAVLRRWWRCAPPT
jgi:PAS domain S-box-containing protein